MGPRPITLALAKGSALGEKERQDTVESLRAAFAKNPYPHLFIASGYYDLATPYYATDYTVRHLGLDPSLQDHVSSEVYPVGHTMYLRWRR